MNKLTWIILLICGFSVAYAQIYKWTDNQGIVHFSDNPHQGSQKVNLPETQTYSPPSPPQPDKDADQKAVTEVKEHQYTKIVITQPLNESTIRNNQGYIVVIVELEPDLIEGDTVQMLFDGQVIGKPQTILSFQLNGVERGAHTIAIQVLNAEGSVLGTSDPITVFMHRPRVGMVKQAGGRN